jgi:hypothetical protein
MERTRRVVDGTTTMGTQLTQTEAKPGAVGAVTVQSGQALAAVIVSIASSRVTSPATVRSHRRGHEVASTVARKAICPEIAKKKENQESPDPWAIGLKETGRQGLAITATRKVTFLVTVRNPKTRTGVHPDANTGTGTTLIMATTVGEEVHSIVTVAGVTIAMGPDGTMVEVIKKEVTQEDQGMNANGLVIEMIKAARVDIDRRVASSVARKATSLVSAPAEARAARRAMAGEKGMIREITAEMLVVPGARARAPAGEHYDMILEIRK